MLREVGGYGVVQMCLGRWEGIEKGSYADVLRVLREVMPYMQMVACDRIS